MSPGIPEIILAHSPILLPYSEEEGERVSRIRPPIAGPVSATPTPRHVCGNAQSRTRESGGDGLRMHRDDCYRRRAAIRSSAAAHPASKKWPRSSMSITNGAWSDGIGFPFRASRSISAQTRRSANGRVTSR